MATVMLRASTCEAVLREMKHAREKGWTVEHDDAAGAAHLVEEAHARLGHMGEVSSPESVKHEIVVAIGLLFHAIDVIDRAQGIVTQSIKDDQPDSYMEFRSGRPE